MLPISVLLMLIAINGFYREVESGVINGEYFNWMIWSWRRLIWHLDQLKENHGGKFDCSQFTDDFDVIRHFPFSVIEAESVYHRSQSGVTFNEEKTFVKSVVIVEEAIVPWNLFCLTRIELLVIEKTPFENGKSYSFIINKSMFFSP